jgi:cytochrome c biogenesis protein CcmG/thiol:disulfide interchange protein DsbE
MNEWWLPRSGAVLLVAALTACGEAGGLPAGAVAVGAAAPAYAAPTLAGDSLSLAGMRGEVVLLNLWATWCPPCREEMPGLEALHREHADQGLRVVGVSTDAPAAADDVRAFLEENGITFTVLHDSREEATRVFRTTGVPETFLIGRDGTLLKRWIGAIDPADPSVLDPIRAALAAPEEA